MVGFRSRCIHPSHKLMGVGGIVRACLGVCLHALARARRRVAFAVMWRVLARAPHQMACAVTSRAMTSRVTWQMPDGRAMTSRAMTSRVTWQVPAGHAVTSHAMT